MNGMTALCSNNGTVVKLRRHATHTDAVIPVAVPRRPGKPRVDVDADGKGGATDAGKNLRVTG